MTEAGSVEGKEFLSLFFTSSAGDRKDEWRGVWKGKCGFLSRRRSRVDRDGQCGGELFFVSLLYVKCWDRKDEWRGVWKEEYLCLP